MSLPRRFYKEVAVSPANAILLDGRAVKTPAKRPLTLPTMALAEAIAEEWRGQAATIDPATLLLTKLANTALDRVIPDRPRIVAEIVEFAGSDLVCYRAETPPDLAARQTSLWDPVIAWALNHLDAPYIVTAGVVHRPQPATVLTAAESHFAGFDPFVLTALYNMMTLTGSALIAAMTVDGTLTPQEAWRAAHADEDFQIEQWGADEEAGLRRQRRQREFMACARFAELGQSCSYSHHART